MKKLVAAAFAASLLSAFAEAQETKEEKSPAKAEAIEQEDSGAPILWGFVNYGFYSGYQLYGSLVNPDPTLQGYAEINANLIFGDLDLGYVGPGVWSNTDLTRRREDLRGAFNEWDFNIHWGRMFWIDDDKTWGVDYRTTVVWYYYPPRGGDHPNTKTTFDWNHSFALVNPYVIPFLDVIHEYTGHGTLLQFGLKRPFQITDDFSLVPSITFVGRNQYYGWCFPNYGKDPETGDNISGGLATMRIQLDATYMFTKWIGVFAKVGYNCITQGQLRDACDNRWPGAYGTAKDFAWGGFGVCVNF